MELDTNESSLIRYFWRETTFILNQWSATYLPDTISSHNLQYFSVGALNLLFLNTTF